MILNALGIALTQLRRNLVHSGLTSLGILIGVAAVIVMVGLGRSASASIEADLQSMGSNILFLAPGGRQQHGPPVGSASAFSMADVEAIQRQVPHLRAVAPQVTASATAIAGDRSWGTSVYGSTRALLEVQGREVADGRVFSAGEERAGAASCLLGATVKEELFGAGSALDARVQLRTLTCTVIGVLEAKGENTMGMDQDDFVLLPISTVQRRLLGDDDVGMIFVSVDGDEHMDAAVRALDDLLRQRRHVASDDAVDFQVMDTREFSSFINGIMQVLTLFLAAVASVSLLVGGIGIMNIMLVSVTERTREIGIRLAIGALERDVLTQFLVEAMVLSAFGGTLGLGVGLLGSWIGARLIGIPFTFDPLVAVGAVAFSALVGIVFGFWPAQRAARMKPIDALRYE